MKINSTNTHDKLTRMDYYQTITSSLMVILGIIILVRSFFTGFFVLTLLVSGGFLFIGIYRLSFVYKYLKSRKK